jgi:hypothetical protein
MGKSIKINESQLRFITKNQILEGQRIEALKSKLAAFQSDLEKMYEIKDYSKEFFEFLDDIRTSGMVNMFQATDLLWSGSDFISRWVYLNAPHLTDNEYEYEDESDDDYSEHKEAYQRVLENADEIRQMIISVALNREGVDYDSADREVKKTAKDILYMWMKHFGTTTGRMRAEVEEVARTLSKGRKHGSGMKFPESAIKANPQRFRPDKRVDESFFFGNEIPDISCDNCGHNWEVEEKDPHPELCHMCGYDQKTEEFDIDSVVEFWVNKNK